MACIMEKATVNNNFNYNNLWHVITTTHAMPSFIVS